MVHAAAAVAASGVANDLSFIIATAPVDFDRDK